MTEILTIPLKISNAFLILGDRPVLVDAGSPGDERKLLDALATAGVRPADLALVVLTHAHTDHTGGLAAVITPNTPIAVGAPDAPPLQRGRNDPLHTRTFLGALIRPTTMRQHATPVNPTVLLDGTTDLHDYGIDATATIVGGHTPGSLIITTGTAACTGDLVRGGLIAPTRTTPRRHFFADDPTGVRNALTDLAHHGIELLHPGHGGPLRTATVHARLDHVAPTP